MPIFSTAQLTAFVEVAAQASFTRAAERLRITQPTVSQLVRALEARVDTPLFTRGRRVELTAAGRALLPHAERAIALAGEAEAAVGRAASDERARLWLAAGEAIATYTLPPALARLRRRLPRLDPRVVVGGEARILSALRSGEADAALLTEHTAPADIERVSYARGRTALVAAADEPAPDRPLELRDLSERVLVVRDRDTINRREVDGVLARAGVEPAGRLEATSLEAVKRCVEAGLGVAIVPAIAIARELRIGTLQELPMRRPALEFDFALAWRRGERPAAAVAALLDELKEEGGGRHRPAPATSG